MSDAAGRITDRFECGPPNQSRVSRQPGDSALLLRPLLGILEEA